MKKMRTMFFVTLLALGLVANLGYAGTIDFEGMPQAYWYEAPGGQQNFGNYWAGVFFGPASTILENQVYGYNDYGYPPHSGHAVLFSISTPYIDAIFDNPEKQISMWYTSYSDFTLDAYDVNDNLIATMTGGANYTTNSLISISTAGYDIKRLRMHDSGNYFTIDDFTAEFVSGQPSGVPEPMTLLLLGFGLAGLVTLRRKF